MFTLLNGIELNTAHPNTFFIPSDEEKNELVPGDFVKIGVSFDSTSINTERFWLRVKTISTDGVKGIVDNDLVFTEMHGLDYQDEMSIKFENILSIMKGD